MKRNVLDFSEYDTSNFSIPDNLFARVEYFFLGEKDYTYLEDLLLRGGAKRANIKSDSITHFICDDIDDLEFDEANALYPGIIVQSGWVIACTVRKRIVPETGFETKLKYILDGVCLGIFSNNLKKRDRIIFIGNVLGAQISSSDYSKVTHLVTSEPDIKKLPKKLKQLLTNNKLEVVNEDWLKICLQTGTKVSTKEFLYTAECKEENPINPSQHSQIEGIHHSSPSPTNKPTNIRYYGRCEDQLLSVPSQVCLLGIKFYISPGLTKNPELKKAWNLCIENYGGEISNVLNASVNHLIIRSLYEKEYLFAYERGIRCTTLNWVNDIMEIGKVEPPFYITHIPDCIDPDQLPLKSLKVCQSGFKDIAIKLQVKDMLELAGGQWSDKLDKDCNFLKVSFYMKNHVEKRCLEDIWRDENSPRPVPLEHYKSLPLIFYANIISRVQLRMKLNENVNYGRSRFSTPNILLSSYGEKEKDLLSKMIRNLGGKLSTEKDIIKVSHIVYEGRTNRAMYDGEVALKLLLKKLMEVNDCVETEKEELETYVKLIKAYMDCVSKEIEDKYFWKRLYDKQVASNACLMASIDSLMRANSKLIATGIHQQAKILALTGVGNTTIALKDNIIAKLVATNSQLATANLAKEARISELEEVMKDQNILE
ncbi:DgyrCDS6422 [Dimorphilus gyrociliatus]|uniref:DgyrCDS6422 n=1 Tax=Dimorphilus gyrociliatus TaxID=2664684 RepID=A0A7I8VN63_9ANNE|nr:DgyrCDS6422 [Dimorphilus gyrociliatus]